MTSVIAYCRSGYEADTAKELSERTAKLNVYGYPVFKPNQGYVEFTFYEPLKESFCTSEFNIKDTVFARQLIWLFAQLPELDATDRIAPILDEVSRHSHKFGAVWVEYPDTDTGKGLAKFCRKFAVPLRQALRKKQHLSKQENLKLPVLHVFFTDFNICKLAVSYPRTRSPFELGVCRLKFPSAAPSRSTLKLEEAIITMLDEQQRKTVFRAGARAVDLGACPGGWTYQLVTREMYVEAVDNGTIDDKLMATGQVVHFAADGFAYKPQHQKVDLLVCDMIEQPDRVAKLMGDWLVTGRSLHAIFNLKLPMKQRYETVSAALLSLKARLAKLNDTFIVTARHLYHDRDEVTVVVIRQC
ncbi:23S rRNA (cytidine(2498)-2'-O)-methyltransferase RlmM [Alteromonas sp. ASW11-130]|uniref:23S rRNA (cytidine(2498)-2'-O)-methyltransferase RlmM n=1 Tax=Alteromonas sp. ASW11-130 TaxID=3015775 RepID=UPI00224263E9|nr:23S rRNA (cytidine(2498)-2'-O)-methyltransferase RlmM [Alteromonas sp. ASW11-130]MCW8090662.1 23S rRNA (cytidine(2498)-2'-O)-methyltransferase RlmM [Alteromonas sp. ASW11-130]